MSTLGRCRSCGAAILWAKTIEERLMPVDAAPEPGGNLRLARKGETLHVLVAEEGWEGRRYRPHFATCPDAASWRRR